MHFNLPAAAFIAGILSISSTGVNSLPMNEERNIIWTHAGPRFKYGARQATATDANQSVTSSSVSQTTDSSGQARCIIVQDGKVVTNSTDNAACDAELAKNPIDIPDISGDLPSFLDDSDFPDLPFKRESD